MTNLELFLLSTALGMDLFSIAVPIGMNRLRIRFICKASVVFAVFHIIMMLGGYYAGHWLGVLVDHIGSYHINIPALLVADWAKILGAIVLILLGIHMLRELGEDMVTAGTLTNVTLLILGISVSLDALAVGFSMGMLDVDLVRFSSILGLVIFTISVSGLTIGRSIGKIIGEKAQIIGGAVLIIFGCNILWLAIK